MPATPGFRISALLPPSKRSPQMCKQLPLFPGNACNLSFYNHPSLVPGLLLLVVEKPHPPLGLRVPPCFLRNSETLP